MKRYPWVKYLKRSQPDLPYDTPLYLGNHSNGEYFHTQTPYERKLREEILKAGDERARKLGMDRREFMASAMGFVTALSVIQQACSSEQGPGANAANGGPVPQPIAGNSGATSSPVANTPSAALAPAPGTAGEPTAGSEATAGASAEMPTDTMMSGPVSGGDASQPGQYCFDVGGGVDPTMCEDAARQVLQHPTFIFDGQTHCFDDAPDAAWRSAPPAGFNESLAGLVGARCSTPADPVSCVGRDDYVRLIFLESDTTMAVLSAWPYGQGPNDPNSNPFLADTRDWVNVDLAGSHRVVNHASVVPWIGAVGMDMAVSNYGVGGWKLYPAAPGNGFTMDDNVGRGFIEKGIELGVKTFAIHKGLPIAGFDVEKNRPRDIGIVAKDYPDCNFIVYHSSICAGQMGSGFTCTPMEGPYVEGSIDNSDALITSLIENGIAPNSNVYAELGGAFSQMMFNPTAAGQWLAKLVQYVGENNVVWGTDSILSGTSPQGQINAFMGLQHPMLTPEIKANILGRNMAKLYCVDVEAQRCQVDSSKLAVLRQELNQEFGEYRSVLLGHQRPLGPTTRREFIRLRKWYDAMGMPG
ncbi:MAG: amidohydrolase family protein [Myxococcales bacterium]|nr:amidohydrolase family protein [Myxococcales bacterium]